MVTARNCDAAVKKGDMGQHFTFAPPCLTVGTVHLESNASCSARRIITLPSDPNKLNFLSSVHRTEAALDAFLHTGYVSFH